MMLEAEGKAREVWSDLDYDETECANCGGEGFTYGCSWDWQCDTYCEGEGTCLCTRNCDWCNPARPDPELQRVLAEALARDLHATAIEALKDRK